MRRFHTTVIYTAVFAGRDEIRRPPPGPYDWRCFTDIIRTVDEPDMVYTPALIPGDPTRSARLVKLMPQLFLPDYERWIWVDGSVAFKPGADLRRLLDFDGGIGTFRHRDRDCAYEEAAICRRDLLDDPETIDRQMRRYQDQGFPRSAGLAETMMVVRNNGRFFQHFNERWWREVALGSRRDQLSFNYVSWASGMSVEYLGRVDDNAWLDCLPHKI